MLGGDLAGYRLGLTHSVYHDGNAFPVLIGFTSGGGRVVGVAWRSNYCGNI